MTTIDYLIYDQTLEWGRSRSLPLPGLALQKLQECVAGDIHFPMFCEHSVLGSGLVVVPTSQDLCHKKECKDLAKDKKNQKNRNDHESGEVEQESNGKAIKQEESIETKNVLNYQDDIEKKGIDKLVLALEKAVRGKRQGKTAIISILKLFANNERAFSCDIMRVAGIKRKGLIMDNYGRWDLSKHAKRKILEKIGKDEYILRKCIRIKIFGNETEKPGVSENVLEILNRNEIVTGIVLNDENKYEAVGHWRLISSEELGIKAKKLHDSILCGEQKLGLIGELLSKIENDVMKRRTRSMLWHMHSGIPQSWTKLESSKKGLCFAKNSKGLWIFKVVD